MKPDDRIDLTGLHTDRLARRRHKVSVEDFADAAEPGISLSEFFNRCLPRIQLGQVFRDVVAAIVSSHKRDRSVFVGLGAHVIKCGVSPMIVRLMREGVVGGVALNGGAAIHDVEIATVGHTSEYVDEGLETGHFGIAEETASLMNGVVKRELELHGPDFLAGMGQLLGTALLELDPPYREFSVLCVGAELGIPVTVHVAIGTDVVHMHHSAHGAAIGQATYNDFRRYTSGLAGLAGGGTYLNIGSAVVLPELFLKAINVLRNLGEPVFDFTAVDLDMTYHYRPSENVVLRPTARSGRGYTLIGSHELLVPLLTQAVLEALVAAPDGAELD